MVLVVPLTVSPGEAHPFCLYDAKRKSQLHSIHICLLLILQGRQIVPGRLISMHTLEQRQPPTLVRLNPKFAEPLLRGIHHGPCLLVTSSWNGPAVAEPPQNQLMFFLVSIQQRTLMRLQLPNHMHVLDHGRVLHGGRIGKTLLSTKFDSLVHHPLNIQKRPLVLQLISIRPWNRLNTSLSLLQHPYRAWKLWMPSSMA